jgi:hypothetical protein
MKTSVVVLTPATNNKAGECVELEYESGPVQFLAPVSYAANDDLGKLRHDEHVAAAALRHGKARGAKAAEIAKLQSAFEAAKSAVDKIHLQMQKQRQAEKTGESPFARQSEDHRVFAEVVDYSRNVDEGDYDDDQSDALLEAQIRAAVTALEEAQSNGASPAKMKKLADALKALRDQLPNPSAPPAATTAPVPRRSSVPEDRAGAETGAIEAPFPGAKKLRDSGPAWKASRSAAAPAVKKTGWVQFLSDLDDRLAQRALAAFRPGGAFAPAAHAKNVCCEGAYKCARCRAKAAAT